MTMKNSNLKEPDKATKRPGASRQRDAEENGGEAREFVQRLTGKQAPASMEAPMMALLFAMLAVMTTLSLVKAQSDAMAASSRAQSVPATNAVAATEPTPVAASASVTNVVTATEPAAVAASAPATNATASPAPPAAQATPSNQTVYYQDHFGRKGELDGSSPDAKNTNKNTWTVSTGAGAYTTNGSGVCDGNAVYDAAFLPVNGTSGVTLDGKQNFTVTATVTPDTAGPWMGIALNTAPISGGHNIFDGGLTEMTVSNGCAIAYSGQTNVKYDPFGNAAGAPYVISMTYHAKSGSITYAAGDSVIATQPNITADQIAALNAVSMGNGASGPTGTISTFALTTGGAD
jgi:hypothetical protein